MSGTHKGTTFFKDDAKQLKKELGDEIVTDALSTGVKTAFTAGADGDFLKNLKIGGGEGDPEWFDQMKNFFKELDLDSGSQNQSLKTYGS